MHLGQRRGKCGGVIDEVWPIWQLPDVTRGTGWEVGTHAVIMTPIHRNICGEYYRKTARVVIFGSGQFQLHRTYNNMLRVLFAIARAVHAFSVYGTVREGLKRSDQTGIT